MELVIYKPKEDAFVQSIEFNYPELKAEINNSLEKYKGITYDDSQINQAKEDRATLNKFSKALNDKKIELKKKYLEPYNDFEVKVKELIGLVAEPVKEIDCQVIKFDQDKKEVKRAEIKKCYDNLIGDMAKMLPFDKIFKDKWLNVSPSMKSIEEELSGLIKQVSLDMETIDNLLSEHVLNIKDVYLKTFDLGSALREKERLEAQKKVFEEKAQKKEMPLEAARAVLEEASPETEVKKIVKEINDPTATVLLEITATCSLLTTLKKFMEENNINYKRCKNGNN